VVQEDNSPRQKLERKQERREEVEREEGNWRRGS